MRSENIKPEPLQIPSWQQWAKANKNVPTNSSETSRKSKDNPLARRQQPPIGSSNLGTLTMTTCFSKPQTSSFKSILAWPKDLATQTLRQQIRSQTPTNRALSLKITSLWRPFSWPCHPETQRRHIQWWRQKLHIGSVIKKSSTEDSSIWCDLSQ